MSANYQQFMMKTILHYDVLYFEFGIKIVFGINYHKLFNGLS